MQPFTVCKVCRSKRYAAMAKRRERRRKLVRPPAGPPPPLATLDLDAIFADVERIGARAIEAARKFAKK